MRALSLVALAALTLHPQFHPAASRLVGEERTRVVQRGESWGSIGARAGVTPSTLARRNGRALASALREGESIVVDNRHIVPQVEDASIVINLPQRLLFHHVDGVLRAHYPIAVGLSDWPTPLGPFTIIEKEENPTWDVPRSIQEEMRRAGKRVLTTVPPGPGNPLGKHWLRLSFGSVGLHGTNAPLSIYRVTTHGCMRVHPDDIADLFTHTALGDSGRIIYEPVLASVEPDGRVFLEVHPDAYRRVPHVLDLAAEVLLRAGANGFVDPHQVQAAVTAREGIAVDVSVKSPQGAFR
ncbi:MAG: L,D-transpeptidase family protein [Acidobacteriota bacterium]|nr:L,D-transpeptidase family protein [Acidobacteriota bacterium]